MPYLKIYRSVAFAGILLMFSCSHRKVKLTTDSLTLKDAGANKTHAATTQKDTIPDDTAAKDQLLRFACLHKFSNPVTKDVFSIALYGKSIDSGKIVFKITDHDHHQFYSETFPASDMLGDLIDEKNGTPGSADTIKNRMASFLNDAHFSSPAIERDETMDDAFENADKSDIYNWKDIKSDPTAVSFTYSHGYESTYGMAYSKKQKKVVFIFYSD
jgi:hypothetical protein